MRKIIIVKILFNNGCFQNLNQMLKYVNPDFQISDLKTGDLVIVVGSEKNESNFQEIERKKTAVCI